ncbi:MAG: GxxExxY protein [Anaerolineales bacterium]
MPSSARRWRGTGFSAVSSLTDAHTAQAIHYLAASRQKVALLINFGGQSLEHRRLVL